MSSESFRFAMYPTEDAEALRERAASQGVSLSGYLRELIHADAARPTTAEVLARIAARESIEASSDDIGSFIDEGRR